MEKSFDMNKNMVSILDFGSSRVTVLCGTADVNNSFRILASAECEYDGFSNGQFLDENNLGGAICKAINSVERELECGVDNLFVGVPAEFCFVYDKMITKTFPKKTKITSKIIDSLFLDDKDDGDYSTHSVINKSPLFYIVNDNNKSNNPLGLLANKIQARTSCVLVENKFKLLISAILHGIGIKYFDFVSSTLAEGIYLLDDKRREEGAILVDCGHITTSVSYVSGDGLKDMKSFSLGGGYITADLAKVLELPFEDAEILKRQAILTLRPTGADYYTIKDNKKFAIKNINEIIFTRIDKILNLINRCIDEFDFDIPDYIPIYLTGGGLNYIEGIKDYFRHEVNRPIELIGPKALLYSNPDLSSSISILNMAINLYK